MRAEERTPSLLSSPSFSWQAAQSNPVLPRASLRERSLLMAKGPCQRAGCRRAEPRSCASRGHSDRQDAGSPACLHLCCSWPQLAAPHPNPCYGGTGDASLRGEPGAEWRRTQKVPRAGTLGFSPCPGGSQAPGRPSDPHPPALARPRASSDRSQGSARCRQPGPEAGEHPSALAPGRQHHFARRFHPRWCFPVVQVCGVNGPRPECLNTHPEGTLSRTPPTRTDSPGWAETSQSPSSTAGTSSSGEEVVGGQEMAPGPDQVPPSLPSSPAGMAAPSTPAPHHPPGTWEREGNKQGWHRCTPAQHPTTPHPLPPQGPPVPSGHLRCPGGRWAGRASHLPRLLARREVKSEKLSTAPASPCRRQGWAAAGRRPRRNTLSSSAVCPGRRREAELPAPRQPGEILRSSLCTAVKYSSQGLSF